ncbi:MAG: GNAT family N-acetyltransferase [Ramlibacter sp.]
MIRTERLTLLGWHLRHVDPFVRLHGDAATMQHFGSGHALDAVEAWLELAKLLGHWQLRGYGVWAVEEAEGGAWVGRAGLFHPPGWPRAELNWMIAPEQRGAGYATEAAAAALDFALGPLGLPEVISLVRPGNVPSLHVVRKLGGELAETITFLGAPMHVCRYVRPRSHPRPQ